MTEARTPLRRKLALSVVALVAPLAAAELGLRLAGYDPLAKFEVDDWRELFIRPSDNPLLVYEPTPGARGHGWDCDIEINARGFRDREYALEKPPGVRRVVVLGDSITFGNMLAIEDTYPEVLEALLAEQGYPCEVLNLGVGGFDTLEEVAFLEQTGLAFDPDQVVVGYCVNDVGTVSINLSYIDGIQRYRAWPYRSRLLLWLRLRLDQGGMTRGFRMQNAEPRFARDNAAFLADLSGDAPLAARMAELRALLPPGDEEPKGHPVLPWYASTPHVAKLRFALERLAGLRDARGFGVLVMLLPYLDEGPLAPAYDLAYDIVAAEAARCGFGVLDLRAPVREAGPARLAISSRDQVHYNALGHAMIARWLGRRLVEDGAVTR